MISGWAGAEPPNQLKTTNGSQEGFVSVLRVEDFRPPGWGLWPVGLFTEKFPRDQKPHNLEVSL